MSEKAVAVVDTNVLLNLALPVVDGRPNAPSGADPLKTLLMAYDIHVPERILGELTDATGSGDLLSAAADLVLQAAQHLTTHDVDDRIADPLEYSLDRGNPNASGWPTSWVRISFSLMSSIQRTTSSSISH